MRVDPATQVLGTRVNVWVAIVVGLTALVFVVRGVRDTDADRVESV